MNFSIAYKKLNHSSASTENRLAILRNRDRMRVNVVRITESVAIATKPR